MASSLSSSLQHVLITGPPGIGKTTLVQKVCAALIEKHNVNAHGFYTNEVRGQGGHGIRIGFDVVGTDGSRAPLARITSPNPTPEGEGRMRQAVPQYIVGKYSVDVESFEKMVLPMLQWKTEHSRQSELENVTSQEEDKEDCVGAVKAMKGEVLVIDEIGKMELFSDRFKDRVASLFGINQSHEENRGVLLATIPVSKPAPKESPLLLALRQKPNCKLFQVTGLNRGPMKDEIVAFILKNFKN